jgi:hypothetical protein
MNKAKRIAVLFLVLALCMSLFTVASAKSKKHGQEDEETEPAVLSEDIQTLKELGLLVGTGKDGLSLEYTKSKPTRMQGFVIYLRLINQENDFEAFKYREGDDNFDDYHGQSEFVKKVMAYAKAHPELNWVGANGKFNPMAHLTAREYAKIMLAALGYTQNTDFTWKDVESFTEQLGIDVPEGAFTIEVLATMTVDTLYTKMKDDDQTLIEYLELDDEDDTTPTVTDVVLITPYVSGPPSVSGRVTVYFSEAMNANTLTDLDNYSVDLDGSAAEYSVMLLSQMTGAAASVSGDKKSVTLTIPGSALAGGTEAGAGITNIVISGLTDIEGNTMDTVTTYVRRASALTVASSAAVDVNKLRVTFSNPMETVKPSEFVLYMSDGITPAFTGTSYTADATGKIITITLSGSLTADAKTVNTDGTTAKLVIGTANTADIFGNKVTGPVAVADVSSATPATVTILDKIAPSAVSINKGSADYTIEVTFTEPVNAVNEATLTAALQIKSLSGALQAATYKFSGSGGTINNFKKLTATITDGTDSKYTVELLGQGIKDMGGNTVSAFAKTTVTVQAGSGPVITARETQDLDKDGYLDAIKLTFNKNIKDSTVNANNFDVAGYSYEVFYPNTAGDTTDNNVIYITFLESDTADTGARPMISYTQGTLADTEGNMLATTGAVAAADKAAPAVVNPLPAGVLTAGGTSSSATLVLSEGVTAANQESVLEAVQAHTSAYDLETEEDLVKTEIWTTGRTLKISLTANANGGVNPDYIVLSAAVANLIDAAGNTASNAKIIK